MTPRVIGLVAVALVGLVGFGLGFAPALAGPRYELCLAVGLSCPVLVAILSALAHRLRAPTSELFDALGLGVRAALTALVVALAHGYRTGFCDLRAGIGLFLLGPMAGIVLASLWGFIAAELAAKIASARWAPRAVVEHPRGLRVVLALAGPTATLATNAGLFYATPSVFAFDPFVGFFSGALYDTLLAPSPLVSYRAASLATLFALYVVALHTERAVSGAARFRSLGRPGLLAVGVIAASSSLASVALGSELGHWQSRGSITRALGAVHAFGSCSVIHEPALADEAARVAADCDAHARELCAWLGLERPVPTTAFLFRNAEHKRALMGAGQTSVAKPWRREIYLQSDEYPHPVLRHELVHVQAGALARGPFAIAGSFAGLLPDPGLIEGLAEAAAPRDDDLGIDEWAAAMRRIGVLPRLDQLFSLRFFGAASSTSYAAAGSFIRHLRTRHGPAPIAKLYRGSSFEKVFGATLAELEQSWWSELDGVRVTSSAIFEARIRFDRPGVLARRCPHDVDRLLDDASGKTERAPNDAITSFGRALALDPANVRALFGIASCHDRARRTAEAEESLDRLAKNASVTEAVRVLATERLGDFLLRRGDTAPARSRFAEVSRATGEEGRLRTLDIKSHYAQDDLARSAIVALLIGTTHAGPDSVEALDRLARWRAASPNDGVPDYLIARMHFLARRYELASAGLDLALAKGIALPRVAAEAERLVIRAACWLGDAARAELAFARYQRLPTVTRERLRAMRDLVQRCAPPLP
ncbi:MAG: hypothetical protein EXR75_14665 [Myxococcales bacterium]|nr:hypothetical protein [Myxococcales bacterium]